MMKISDAALSVHGLAGFTFSAFVAFHLFNHAYGAIFGALAHEELQKKMMIRGTLEVLLIGVPALCTWLSGWILLAKAGPKAVAASFSGVVHHFISGKPLTQEGSARIAIRHLQIASAAVFGVCLTSHSAAVLFFRYVGGKPINIEVAAHGLHDPAMKVVGNVIFALYYFSFAASFPVHVCTAVINSNLKNEKKGDESTINAAAAGRGTSTATTSSSTSAVASWRRIVLPVVTLSVAFAAFIVVGTWRGTSHESTAKHWVFKN